ncbi:type I restriction-modification system endonuclease [Mediterraneibacter sp. NSJ-55]|uniref:Type I restriction-modification system endonuclease n=1 Tax=Mediterraneibacter hominis TaxID=2763054 RepID=A0A923LF61_9FIRM|nr:type I restriction-modification system endonuclease [Mediterraneibacter hominis]MBC5687476.1 type I restriction-modification system endonuclease [Mediterraneibacter hominis]
MKSNFEFLNRYWPVLAQLGANAENYLYSDPNACIYKLGMFAERLVQEILVFEHMDEPQIDNTHANRIRLLKRAGLLPHEIDNTLYVLRKTRNSAVHAGTDSVDEAKTLLSITYNLAVWFMEIYGDWGYIAEDFVMPEEVHQADLKSVIEDQEKKIAELSKKLAQVTTAVSGTTQKERAKRAETVSSMMQWNEAQTRCLIDEQLRKAGWEADTANLRYSKGTRPVKGRNIAISEWPTNSAFSKNGYVDYAFFIGEKLVALMDAKKVSEDVASTIDVQVKDYATHIKKEHSKYIMNSWDDYQVPFLFASNGRAFLEQLRTKSGIWFLDARKSSNQSYPIRNWFSPSDLEEKLSQNIDKANENLATYNDSFMENPNGLSLRDYQIKAINKTTEAIISGKRTALLAMATGTGKTHTVLGLIYKMLESKRFKRILFLVDRVSLGEQAMDTFKDVKLKAFMTLDKIYEIKDINDNEINPETKVSVSTVQGLLKRTVLSETPDLMPGAFDLIIVDEAHRGYILDREMTEEEILYDNQADYMSKYKQVIEYFDAVKVALTATPALHTTEIFGEPIFTYSYREAVIDGWLVDHDPPYIINTDFIENKARFKKGETLAQYDPNTNELINGSELQDEMDFDVSEFNRKIILPDHTRKVLEEISNYINPESREKTLIFAVNDNHADRIVDTLRDIYKPYGVSNDAIMKITGKTAGGNKKKILQVIKQFKNNQYPNIAVTVDLLTTGIDVPAICNLVFMRKINSRILFEQMLGRATRLCPEIGKTHFNIFDAVRVYEDLDSTSGMKSVSVKKTMPELLEDLFRNGEENKQQIIDRILARLQRKSYDLTPEQKYDISERLGGIDLKTYAHKLKSCTQDKFIEICKKDRDFLLWVDSLKGKKKGYFYSEKADILKETTRGYGSTKKPEDYLDAFTKYINENKDKIEAIRIACTKPSDMTRAQLRELKLALDNENFTETSLNEAASAVTNAHIVADIIAHVRKAVLKTPLFNHEERIEAAFAKLTAAHRFNKMQLDLLEKIKTYMLHESILNTETFEAPVFKMEGGFVRFNKKFGGTLVEIIREINTYIYEGAA